MKDHLKKIWTGPTSGDPKPIIYIGGVLGGGSGEKALKEHPKLIRYCCLSYFYLNAPKYADLLQTLKQNGTRCFLDSGAFSWQIQALKKNQPLTPKTAEKIIDQYADWVEAADFIFDFIVTFDYLRDPDIMWLSTKRLEERGLHPVPVYHLGTSVTALRTAIDRGYTLIGIGGLIPFNGAKARPFLDQVFNITEKHGIRLHGLGVGGSAMFDYPWFSCDSTAWLHLARIGKVYRASRDPRRLYDTVPVSSKQTAVALAQEDNQTERIAINFRFLNQLMDNSQKSTPRKKGLF